MIELYLKKTDGNPSEEAHGLLRQILAETYQICQPELCYGPQGKPYLPEGPCFNISHSRGYVALAFSQWPIGLDVELVRAYHGALPERIFSKDEYQWFQERDCCKVDFFTLWTLKESYYKYLGTGLPGFPNGTEFYKTDVWRLRGSDLWFHVMEEKTLLLTLCGEKQSAVNLHRL